MKSLFRLVLGAALCSLFTVVNPVFAQGTAFTYQGQLNVGGNPASGSYDLTFALFTDSGGVTQAGNTLTNTATAVSKGLFTVALDFGVGSYDKHIAVVDEGGVALAAIQGLNQKLNEKDAEIQDLKARLARLEKLLTATTGGGK